MVQMMFMIKSVFKFVEKIKNLVWEVYDSTRFAWWGFHMANACFCTAEQKGYGLFAEANDKES